MVQYADPVLQIMEEDTHQSVVAEVGIFDKARAQKFEMSTVVFYVTGGMITDPDDRLLLLETITEVVMVMRLLVEINMMDGKDGVVDRDLPPMGKGLVVATAREVLVQDDVKR